MNKELIQSVKGIAEVIGLDGVGAELILFVKFNKTSDMFQMVLGDLIDIEGLKGNEKKEFIKNSTPYAFINVVYDTSIGEYFQVTVDGNGNSILSDLTIQWEDCGKIRKFINEKRLYDPYVIEKWEKKGRMYEKYKDFE